MGKEILIGFICYRIINYYQMNKKKENDLKNIIYKAKIDTTTPLGNTEQKIMDHFEVESWQHLDNGSFLINTTKKKKRYHWYNSFHIRWNKLSDNQYRYDFYLLPFCLIPLYNLRYDILTKKRNGDFDCIGHVGRKTFNFKLIKQ